MGPSAKQDSCHSLSELHNAVTQEDILVWERAWHMAVIYSYFEADAKVFLRDFIGIPSLPLVSSWKQYARGQTRLWTQLWLYSVSASSGLGQAAVAFTNYTSPQPGTA